MVSGLSGTIGRRIDLGAIRVATKVQLAVGVLAFAAAILAVAGVWSLERVSTAADRIGTTSQAALLGGHMNRDVIALSRAEYRLAVRPDAITDIRAEVERRVAAFETRHEKALSLAAPDERAMLERIGDAYDSYMADFNRTLELAAARTDLEVSGDRAELLSAVQESRDTSGDLRESLAAYVDEVEERTNAASVNAAATSNSVQLTLVVLAVVAVLAGLALGYVIARNGIVRPLSRCIRSLKSLAGGDLETEIYGSDRKDEIGDIAEAMVVFRDQSAEAERYKREQAEKEERAEREQRERMERLADTFEREVGEVVRSVGASGEELNQSAESMGAVSEENSRQAQAVSAAAEQAASSVQTVASAAEELASSIEEINSQVSQSTSRARGARNSAEQAGEQVAGLDRAAEEIGGVIQLINEIAEKTNLLALNATIEAARAGDAGKGFAVVAEEVKQLAQQTTDATSKISERIDKVQGETKQAVAAIEGIAAEVKEIDESTSAIASAIEEQSSATREITHNVQEASTGTQEVTSNITAVSEAANESGSAAQQVLSASSELNTQARVLNEKVDTFLDEVRAAA